MDRNKGSLSFKLFLGFLAICAFKKRIVTSSIAASHREGNGHGPISVFKDRGMLEGILQRPFADETESDNQCGGVLDTFNKFSIHTLSYKYKKPTDKFESCVWTIHARNSAFIQFSLTPSYFRDANNDKSYVSVGYFTDCKYDSLNALTWFKFPFSVVSETLKVPGPVAFIHFVTGSNYPGLGFRLTYKAAGEDINLGYNYENFFLEGKSGVFEYPTHGGKYKDFQRTTIVMKIVPEMAMSSSLSRSNYVHSHVMITKKGIEESVSCLADSLNIYGFGEAGNTWYKNRTMCGTSTSTDYYVWNDFAYPRNDPIIITFKSDGRGVGDGFELWWVRQSF